MSEEWENYVADPRPVCKFGIKCYQKNPQHTSRFKHPPQSNAKRKIPTEHADEKRHKVQESDSAEADNSETNVTTIENVLRDEACKSPENIAPETDSQVITNSEVNVNSNDKVKDNSNDKFDLPRNLTFYDVSLDREELIKDLFLVKMPTDFYTLYECLKEDGPVEEILARVNLELIGPYDLLLGKLPIIEDKELYLIHWRFFFDPPEFQTILKTKGKSQLHFGYFRDDPEVMPEFVASNDSEKKCNITPVAHNIFGAIYIHLQNEKKCSPFKAMACQKLIDKIKKWAKEHNFSLEEFPAKKRAAKTVSRTFHGAGIVVPYDKKTQVGYRPLVENNEHIKKIFNKIDNAESQTEKDKALSELQPVVTYASIAVDECDFGTGLECGINLFCSGIKALEPSALSCLTTAYTLLKRNAYVKIIKAHLKYRRKGPNMSLLNVNDT